MVPLKYLSPTLMFLTFIFSLALLLFPRAVLIAPLYLKSELRTDIRDRLSQVSDQRGWVRSDIRIRSISSKRVKFIYGPHTRARRLHTCYLASLEYPLIIPCGRAF